jgi:hypothetical protein
VPRPGFTYFADENLLGLAKLLVRQGRSDIAHPGHPALPEVPLGARDVDWMRVVARLDLIVLSRDRRFRTRDAEQAVYRELGIRSVWLGARHDVGPQDQLAMFLKHEQRLRLEARKRGAGPWALAMTPSGIRPIELGH